MDHLFKSPLHLHQQNMRHFLFILRTHELENIVISIFPCLGKFFFILHLFYFDDAYIVEKDICLTLKCIGRNSASPEVNRQDPLPHILLVVLSPFPHQISPEFTCPSSSSSCEPWQSTRSFLTVHHHIML